MIFTLQQVLLISLLVYLTSGLFFAHLVRVGFMTVGKEAWLDELIIIACIVAFPLMVLYIANNLKKEVK